MPKTSYGYVSHILNKLYICSTRNHHASFQKRPSLDLKKKIYSIFIVLDKIFIHWQKSKMLQCDRAFMNFGSDFNAFIQWIISVIFLCTCVSAGVPGERAPVLRAQVLSAGSQSRERWAAQPILRPRSLLEHARLWLMKWLQTQRFGCLLHSN